MTTTTHERMHGEHRFWESEINLWREDLRAWQHELAHAQGEITQLETALEQHARTLKQHASALRLEEQKEDSHEHAIVKYEQGGEGDELFEMAREHSEEALRHAGHRTAHEQLKRRHHTVIAHWNVLLKALREPAEAAPVAEKPAIIVPQ
jgi:chromosome segregation ATPase